MLMKDVVSCDKSWGVVIGVDLGMFEWGNLFGGMFRYCLLNMFPSHDRRTRTVRERRKEPR